MEEGWANGVMGTGVPSKSTISPVRYGFSLWHEGQRRLNTGDFSRDAPASCISAVWMSRTIAGTGIGALQCRHTTPRKDCRSVSRVISNLAMTDIDVGAGALGS